MNKRTRARAAGMRAAPFKKRYHNNALNTIPTALA